MTKLINVTDYKRLKAVKKRPEVDARAQQLFDTTRRFGIQAKEAAKNIQKFSEELQKILSN